MKIGFIIITAGEPAHFAENLKKEVKALAIRGLTIYHIKNKRGTDGYSAGVNRGIRKAQKDGKDLFIIANPDISIKGLTKEDLLSGAKYFDVWGFSLKQNGELYYEGKLDKWRMSGSLSTTKPDTRFADAQFVSGALICIKKSVIDTIGLWDEDYFLYYDEVDYCTRAKRAGLRVGIDSEVAFNHYELSEENNPKKSYYLARSRLMFLWRFGSVSQKLYELARLPKTLTEERPFVLNFLTLNLSSFINKVLNFVLFIFLVRYLSVAQYGWYTLVWAHVGLLQSFLDFGTTSYGLVHLPKEEDDKKSSLFTLRLMLGALVFASTVALAIVLGYRGPLLWYIFLTSFTLFSNVFSGSLLIFSSVKGKLMLPSVLSIVFNTALIVALITALVTGGTLNTVFILVFLFYNVYTIANFIFVKKITPRLHLSFQPKQWLSILKKSTTFLLISLFAGLYFKLDVFLLNFIKGAREVGIYSSGYKFLEAFLFIAASYNLISTPFMSKLVKNKMYKDLVGKVKRDILHLVPLGLGLALCMFVLSPHLLTFLFKRDYQLAIPVLQVVIFALPLIFATSIFFNALYALGKERVVVVLFIVQTILTVSLNILLIPQYSYMASAYITIIAEAINTAVAYIFLKRAFHEKNIT